MNIQKKKFLFFFVPSREPKENKQMAESGNKRKASDPMAEVRAAVREAERAEWIGNTYDFFFLL
jgi:hypothetical protein